ncbi:hypothetical protein, partial [Kocuria rosea]|uniref:hypothetical protein n=1 Tax=Kocuria rosea TaxID=1275 RepID=UPI002B24BBCB
MAGRACRGLSRDRNVGFSCVCMLAFIVGLSSVTFASQFSAAIFREGLKMADVAKTETATIQAIT